jgi:hypothetical protein
MACDSDNSGINPRIKIYHTDPVPWVTVLLRVRSTSFAFLAR